MKRQRQLLNERYDMVNIKNKDKIDVSQLPNGIYDIKLITENAFYSDLFIKE